MTDTLRLSRLADLLRLAALAAVVLLLGIPLLGIAAPEGLLQGLAFRPVAGLPAGPRLLAGLLLALPFLAAAAGFAALYGFAARLQAAEIFTTAAATALRRLGSLLLAAALLLPPSRLAAGWIAGLPLAGPGVLLGTAAGAAFGLVVLAFAAVLAEARRVAEENAAFI